MKKLITVAELEHLLENNQRECVVTKNTIITPAAVDFAEENNIKILEEQALPQENLLDECLMENLVKLLSNQEILTHLIEALGGKKDASMQKDPSGLTIISGKSIKPEPINQKDSTICEQIIFENQQYQAGILCLEDTCLKRNVHQEEVQLVLSGTVETKINQMNYLAEEQDIICIPKYIDLRQCVQGTARIFYVRLKV